MGGQESLCLSALIYGSLTGNFIYIIEWLSGFSLAVVILACGLYLTVRSGFFPLRRAFAVIKYTVLAGSGRRLSREGDITPFQALTTALAATVGTGNIAGIATALTLGGPGAIFWMWVAAAVGMMIKFSEIVLAVHYRKIDVNGDVCGGPMYVLGRGLGSRFLAYLFAGAGTLAALGIGNLVQANSVAAALQVTAGVPSAASGVIMVVLVGLVIIGGIKRIGYFTAAIVPVMTLIYLGGVIFILIAFYRQIPAAFALILSTAFTGSAALGGFAGAGVLQGLRYGISRGIFTNEAGLGSASIAHAASQTDHPVRQGLWGILEVGVDTHLVCTMTALSLLVTGAWTSGLAGASMTVEAFERVFCGGGALVAISLIFFAFSTLISWFYYGEKCFQYIWKQGDEYYRVLWLIAIFIGATGGLRIVWALSDILNVFMVLPNLIAVLGLSGVVWKLTGDFFGKK